MGLLVITNMSQAGCTERY